MFLCQYFPQTENSVNVKTHSSEFTVALTGILWPSSFPSLSSNEPVLDGSTDNSIDKWVNNNNERVYTSSLKIQCVEFSDNRLTANCNQLNALSSNPSGETMAAAALT